MPTPPLPTFMPDHPLEPLPPTFMNRLTCKFRGHEWALLDFNYMTFEYSNLCLRCSRTKESRVPSVTLDPTPTVEQR